MDSALRNSVRISVLLLTLFGFLLIFSACDPYANKQPAQNTQWVCETPYITLSVDEQGICFASLAQEENELKFCMGFQAQRVIAYTGGTLTPMKTLFKGEYTYGKKFFTVFITEDNLWDGDYNMLKFTRVK